MIKVRDPAKPLLWFPGASCPNAEASDARRINLRMRAMYTCGLSASHTVSPMGIPRRPKGVT